MNATPPAGQHEEGAANDADPWPTDPSEPTDAPVVPEGVSPPPCPAPEEDPDDDGWVDA